MPKTTRIEGTTGHPSSTLRYARHMAANPRHAPAERSKAPALSATTTPSVRTTSTDCDPKIVWKFPDVRKVDGSRTAKRMATTAQTPTSA